MSNQQDATPKASSGQVISATPQVPGQTRTDTQRIAEPGYYVILGWGVTALYNHLTLIDRAKEWGKPKSEFDPKTDWATQRLSAAKSSGPARLPVMHIGFREPWERRQRERMGQWPRMLNFFDQMGDGTLGINNAEGYDALDQREWLPSKVFAAGLSGVEKYIDEQYKYSRVQDDHQPALERGRSAFPTSIIFESGFVAAIEHKDKPLIRDDSFGSVQDSADEWEKRLWDKVQQYWAGNRTWSRGKPDKDFQTAWNNSACPYRLSVYRQIDEDKDALRLRYVYAHKIDICSGPGQPRLFKKTNFESSKVWESHLPEWTTPPNWRKRSRTKVIDGNEYIGYGNKSSETAIVFKGNPVGAQSVQSALDMPEMRENSSVGRVWFISNKDLRKDDANVPGDRNLLEVVGASQLSAERQRINETARIFEHHIRDKDKDKDTVKADQCRDWTSGEVRKTLLGKRLLRVSNHEIEKISLTDSGVRCTLTRQGERATISEADANKAVDEMLAGWNATGENTTPPGCQIDGSGTTKIVKQVEASYLVYSQGQDRGDKCPGSVAFITRKMDLTNFKVVKDPKTNFPMTVTDGEKDKEVDGIQGDTETGGLRILGSAIMNCSSKWDADTGKLHFDPDDFPTRDQDGALGLARNRAPKSQAGTIPREGPAGGGGLNLNIPNIWRANRYFGKGIASINTAAAYELEAAGLSSGTAKHIVAARSLTDRGFSIQEYLDLLKVAKLNDSSIDPATLENNRAKLKF